MEAPTAGNAAGPIVPVTLERAAIDAFGGVVNPHATGLIASIRRAIRYAVPSRPGEGNAVVLDKRAMLLGIIHLGLAEPNPLKSSTWFIEWLSSLSADLQAILAAQARERVAALASRPDTGVILSQSMLRLLPQAQALARDTVRRDIIDLRHLLFELARAPGDEWTFLASSGRSPDLEDFRELRRIIVDRIAGSPEPNEDLAAWRRQLGASTPPARPDDRYRTLPDDPATIDALEREPFAQVLAERIVEVWNDHRKRGTRSAFIIHIHGPWGSGKSSTLNFLGQQLESREPEDERALVVWFNAWQHQRIRPPWWSLLTTIYAGAVAKPAHHHGQRRRHPGRWRLMAIWNLWRLLANWAPLLVIGVVMLLVTGAIWRFGPSVANWWNGFGQQTPAAIPKDAIENSIKIGGTAITALLGLAAYARVMLFGSHKAAQTYSELATDAYRPIIRLFERLVRSIKSPLVVFIDDLDRCDSDYVVELLEGIQTLFRGAPVTYVVAADRRWICTSFEKKYGDFAGELGEPCRPLGYLFLEKMFQISAGMPRLTQDLQRDYLRALLSQERPIEKKALSQAAAERVKDANDSEALQLAVEAARKEGPAVERAVRAAAALKTTGAEAAQAREHRLHKLAHLLERNPRAMKRLVNAVGMAEARGLIEGRAATPEVRARWTMLQLRWPILAEFIAEAPERVAFWNGAGPEMTAGWPKAVQPLKSNQAVKDVVGAPGEEGALTPEVLKSLLA